MTERAAPDTASPARLVLAVDPGSHKCGVAVVSEAAGVLALRVVESEALSECVAELLRTHRVTHLVLGDRTGFRRAAAQLRELAQGLPVIAVDEHLSSLEARRRYFREHRPRGLWRLIPLGLQVPPCPIDDYVAVILAERYLSGRSASTRRAALS